MPQDAFRIFLSAVTSEFGRARGAVAADLRARGLTLRVQSDFRQEAETDTTLKKLHDYIRDCSAVVCIIGRRSGAKPPPAAAAPFAAMLPRASRRPPERGRADGSARAGDRRGELRAWPSFNGDRPQQSGRSSPEKTQMVALVMYIW